MELLVYHVKYWTLPLLLSLSMFSGGANAYEISGLEFQPVVLVSDRPNDLSNQNPGANFSLNFNAGNAKTEFSIPVNRYSIGTAGCCNTDVLDVDLQLLLFTNDKHTGLFAGPFLRAQRLSVSADSTGRRSSSGFRAGIGINVGVRYNCGRLFDSLLADAIYPTFYCSTGLRAGYMTGSFRAGNELYGKSDLATYIDLIRFGIRFN